MVDSEKMKAIGWIPIHEAFDYEFLVERLTPLDRQKSSDRGLQAHISAYSFLLGFEDSIPDPNDATYYRFDNISGDALQINSKIPITDDFIPICVKLNNNDDNNVGDSALILLIVKSVNIYQIVTHIIINIEKSGIIVWKVAYQNDSYFKNYHYNNKDALSETQIKKIYEYLLWDIYCKFVYLVDGNDTRFIDVWGGQFFISPYNYEAKSDEKEKGDSYYSDYLNKMRDNITLFLTKSQSILERAKSDLSKAISDIAPNDKKMNMTPQLFDMSDSPYYPFSEYNSSTKEAVRYVRLYNRSQIKYNALFKEIGDAESYYKLIETVNKLIEETLKKYGDYLKRENDFQKRLNLALNIDSFNSSKKMENLTYVMVLIGFGTMAIEIVANLSSEHLYGAIQFLSLIYLLFSLPFGMMSPIMNYDEVAQNISDFLEIIKGANIGLGLFQFPILIIVLAIALWVIFCKNKHM